MTLNYRDFAAIGSGTDTATAVKAVEEARAKMNSSTHQPTPKTGPVIRELERTHRLLCELRSMNDSLQDRLGVILAEAGPTAEAPQPTAAPGASDMARGLTEVNNRLTVELEFLGNLMARIEL